MTRSICEELLEELRELRADVHPDGFVEALTLDELAALITKRERAAAERMRVAAADVVNLHETMTGEACGLSAEILDLKLEPEEPSECK